MDLSDPNADYNKDGVKNFTKFAFGLDPTSGASISPITVGLNKQDGTFSYTRRANSGVVYTIWTSPDMSSWTQDTTAGQVAGAANGQGVQTVVVTLTGTKPLSAAKLFIQVRVSQPAP